MRQKVFLVLFGLYFLIVCVDLTSYQEKICRSTPFTSAVLKKSTGSSVNVYISSANLAFNWFEAASCCASKNKNLVGITNARDLELYYNMREGDWKSIGWSDVHSFGKDWRNLRGKYLDMNSDVFQENPPQKMTRGVCKHVSHGMFHNTDKFYLVNLNCDETLEEMVVCEDQDPKNPYYNYDCGNKYPKDAVFNDRAYWEDVLSYNPVCEGERSTESQARTYFPPPIPDTFAIRNADIIPSKAKLSWREAVHRCEASGLILLIIDTENDNTFLNNNKQLKQPPYGARESFWSGARFRSTDYKVLLWDSIKRPISDFMDSDSSISKSWNTGEPLDDDGEGKDLCVDMMFPGKVPPIWSASNCDLKKHYICMRPLYARVRTSEAVTLDEGEDTEDSSSSTNPLTDNAIAHSKAQLTWSDALAHCHKSGLVLLVIESEEDNNFLNNARKLKISRMYTRLSAYSPQTRYWSAAKFSDDSELYWEPIHKKIPDHTKEFSGGIRKAWDVAPAPEPEEDIACVDIQFPGGKKPPRWTVSDCTEKRYYLCMQPEKKRQQDGTKKRPQQPATIVDENEEDELPPPLTVKDITTSRGKQTWKEAKKICEDAKLVLLVIESEEDNEFLNKSPKLKQKPYEAGATFWSAARFTSSEYTKLVWEPSKKPFPNFLQKNANGIKKWWAQGEPSDDGGSGKETCVDMRFPGRSLPVWSASDCDEKKFFICMKPSESRKESPSAPARPIKEPEPEPEEPEEQPSIPIRDADAATSKAQLSWSAAKAKCLESGLTLLVIETEEDNKYLNYNPKLKKSPYTPDTQFWSGGKFTSSEYLKMIWEPTKKEFPNFRSNNANGIKKWWATGEPVDDTGSGNELCVSMQFPGKSPPIWRAENCEESKYYICIRPSKQRGHDVRKVVKIVESDTKEETEKTDVETSVEGTFHSDIKTTKSVNCTLVTTTSTTSTTTTKKYTITHFTESITTTKTTTTTGTFISTQTSTSTSETTSSSSTSSESGAFSSAHGLVKQIPGKKGTLEFIPDPLVNGEFKPDKGPAVPGTMTQTPPETFTPDSPPFISRPTSGTWKPSEGLTVNYPCKTVKGTMRPIPTSQKNEAEFIPDPILRGSFIPDDKSVPVFGTLTQTNPPEFSPSNPNDLFQKPTSGTWRPKPLTNPAGITHGVMNPNGEVASFIPDDEIHGNFVPDENLPPFDGSMTTTIPKMFTPYDKTDFSTPIPGTWQPNSNPQKGAHGVLRPDSNIPPDSALFEPKTKDVGKVKPTSPAVKQITNPSEGYFIPDSNTRQLVFGNMEPGEVLKFTPKTPVKGFTRLTPGTYKPETSDNPEYPYSTIHGTLKPYKAVVGSFIFMVDAVVTGEFIVDVGSQVYPGTLSQDSPLKFTSDFPPYITETTQGNWRQTQGVLPNFPCSTVHGTMQPDPDSETNSIFTPDPSRHGVFTPDSTSVKPVTGTLTQENPPRFSPDSPSFKFQQPTTSGTWKPRPLYTQVSISHGIMKTTKDGTIFVSDEFISGKFVPDKDSLNSMEGYMTQKIPQVFFPFEDKDLSRPLVGIWISVQSPNSKAQSIPGTLKPNINLPPNSALFLAGTGHEKNDASGGDSSEGTVGKFYRDVGAKNPVAGSLAKESPFKFTPQNPSADLTGAPKGTWIPDKPTDPYDPFSSWHGIMDQGEDGPVYIPDVLVEGVFIPDANPIEMPGTLNMESNPKLFTPTTSTTTSDDFVQTLGLWRPNIGSPFYPYSTIKGTLKPSPTEPGSAYFTPDLTVEGEFIPQGGQTSILGNMNQGNPIIFTSNEAVSIKSGTQGIWRPFEGTPSSYPFVITIGSLEYTSEEKLETTFNFVASEKFRGTFIPDDPDAQTLSGQATQSNPTKFLPTGASNTVKKTTSGTWKPQSVLIDDNSNDYTHCVLSRSEDKTENHIFFTADVFVTGKFVTEERQTRTIYGSLTKSESSTRSVFKISSGETITTTTSGTFYSETSSQSQSSDWYSSEMHGSLVPSTTDSLPFGQVYFIPDSGRTKPKIPETKQQETKIPKTPTKSPKKQRMPPDSNKQKPTKVKSNSNRMKPEKSTKKGNSKNCDPKLSSLDKRSRFYVPCDDDKTQIFNFDITA